ncbi:MAG: AAA family ATPase [Peptoniphilus harei]|uniref:guanylate kinase n=1 Tax=Peptoniphilus harei TaxID=54005 RepID=UPI0029007C99|nr:AAA family ATPase [Peptoniphilus harei]MDU2374523.1 AAA family ATPase [Peptoniphilus harei]
MIYLILGHSGSGKSTIRNALTSHGIKKIITYTTRPPRISEVDGMDYNFIEQELFKKMNEDNLFIGTTCYVGNYYSTLREDLEKNNNKDSDCVIVVDKEGVLAIKKEFANARSIYLKCSRETLRDRMIKRSDDAKDIEKRLDVLEDLDPYADYIIDADRDIDSVFEDVISLIKNIREGK